MLEMAKYWTDTPIWPHWTDLNEYVFIPDTYANEVLCDRAVAQIKTFSDKGADRKFR